jgi:hypothetical protein
MMHPIMFDDDDPYLVRLRAIALAFPGAEEVISHGRPNFRVKKVFVVYGSGTKGPAETRIRYDHGLVVLPEEAERLALEQDPRFFLPAYLGPSGWVGIDLAAGGRCRAEQVDWAEVAELVDGSYRQVAGARLVARLDAEGSPAGRGRV